MSAVTFDADDVSLTIAQFCLSESISITTFHKMQRLGLGPELMRIPGTRLVRISPGARKRFHEKLERLAKSEAGQREHEHRARLASAAGRIAVQSEKHIVNQRRRMVRKLGKQQSTP
jgi:hypothetical protein